MAVPGRHIVVRRLDPGTRFDWRAPYLWQSEFRSAASGLIRRAAVTVDEAIEKMQTALSFVTSESVDAEQVLRLVTESPCTAYDLEFVALAQQLETQLVTNERQILQSFPAIAVSPVDFALA